MGREFVDIFDEWIHAYDEAVSGQDPEYQDVFNKYDEILESVTDKVVGTVLEFGIGTGNLTAKLINAGHEVMGIEPSQMARQFSKQRFPSMMIKEGDLLDFDLGGKQIQTVASSYVFHHLTDIEKGIALKKYAKLLPAGGKVVFADTVFLDEKALQDQLSKERARGFHTVADDLEREYYTTIPILFKLFQEAGFQVAFEKMNDYVWLMDATRR